MTAKVSPSDGEYNRGSRFTKPSGYPTFPSMVGGHLVYFCSVSAWKWRKERQLRRKKIPLPLKKRKKNNKPKISYCHFFFFTLLFFLFGSTHDNAKHYIPHTAIITYIRISLLPITFRFPFFISPTLLLALFSCIPSKCILLLLQFLAPKILTY